MPLPKKSKLDLSKLLVQNGRSKNCDFRARASLYFDWTLPKTIPHQVPGSYH